MDSYRYEFVELKSGNIPFVNFLNSLEENEIADIKASMDELIEWLNENKIPPNTISKYLRNGIFELKVRHKDRITRSLYFYFIDKMIIFTNGFIKKKIKHQMKKLKKP
jgi:phage-related protein